MRNPADKQNAGSEAGSAPRSNRAIIGLGLLLCVVGAIVAAWLLGLLDRIGVLS
jgi:hypothetical protein